MNIKNQNIKQITIALELAASIEFAMIFLIDHFRLPLALT